MNELRVSFTQGSRMKCASMGDGRAMYRNEIEINNYYLTRLHMSRKTL